MRSLVVLLALSAWGTAQASSLDNYVTKCEVKQIAAEWKMSIGQAKKELKREIAKGDKSYYSALDSAAYMPANCRFSETGLLRSDAETLAGLWGTDVPGAMRNIEQKFANGDGKLVRDALAGKMPPTDWKADADEAGRFFASNYHYCDARVLADLWGIDVYSGKKLIGRKLNWGDPATMSYLEGELARGRAQAAAAGHPCEFVELSYSYDDATTLASVWGVPVEQAKTRMADMVMKGRDGELRQQIAMRRAP